MIEQLLNYDSEFFLFLNNLGNENWDAFWMAYTTKWNWIPFYAILLYLLFKQSDLKSFILTVVMVVAMMFFTDQMTNVFKDFYQRPRPCHIDEILANMRLIREGCGGKFGYFSGHSSNSMAVAIFVGTMLRYRFQYLIYILIVWAMLMAYSRVYVGVHYPLDILSGMIFGAISGLFFYKLTKYLNSKMLPLFNK